MIYVLDACAMIAFLRKEPGAGVVKAALMDPANRCIAHALNLCEVFYEFHRSIGSNEALSALADLNGVGVVASAEMTPGFWQAAGTLKSVHRKVSLADCFAIALT